MSNQSGRPTDEQITQAVDVYSNMLYQLCVTMLGNCADAEDAVSETFVRYITKSPPCFHSEEHRKAWLLRVAANLCNDMCRLRRRHAHVNIEDVYDLCEQPHDSHVLEDIMRLPVKYRTVLHLHYIEGYSTNEIAQILSISPAAVRKRLQYAREKLKLELDLGQLPVKGEWI